MKNARLVSCPIITSNFNGSPFSRFSSYL